MVPQGTPKPPCRGAGGPGVRHSAEGASKGLQGRVQLGYDRLGPGQASRKDQATTTQQADITAAMTAVINSAAPAEAAVL